MAEQPQFDVNGARQAGASDDQILDYLAQRTPNFDMQGALKQASKADVINYLSVHASPPQSSQAQSAPADQPGFVSRAWDWANKGLVSGQDIGQALFGSTPQALHEKATSAPTKFGMEHPYLSAAGRFFEGSGADLADTASSLTSPLSAALTAATLGEGTAARVGAKGLASGLRVAQGAAGAGFAGKGAADIASAGTENTPEAWQQRLQGGAMLAGGAAAAGRIPAGAARLQAPLGDAVSKPRGTIPAESYSPTELKAYADQHGIPLNAAQATEHNLPRNVQSAGERASVGGTAVRQQIRASQAAIADHAEKLMDAVSPGTPDVATAGDRIQQNVAKALETEQVQSRQQYAAIDQQANGVKVDMRPLKDTANRILSDSNFLRKSGLDPRKASVVLEHITSIPDRASFADAQQVRSGLLDISRTPELAISNQAQGWIKQLTGTVDSEMMNAATSKPGLEPTFRAANEHWQQLQEDFNNPRSPLFQILQEPDPSKVPQKLTQRGQIGGSPYNAELLDKYGIDKGPVKWSILNDLGQKDFRLMNKNLGGYGDEFLRSVFTPEELDHVYKTGAIARSVGINTNPSGTAGVSGAMEDVRSPLRSLLPKGLAARATRSPAFNDWMMRQPSSKIPPRVPLSLMLGQNPEVQDWREGYAVHRQIKSREAEQGR